jgi:hypothetical protein
MKKENGIKTLSWQSINYGKNQDTNQLKKENKTSTKAS